MIGVEVQHTDCCKWMLFLFGVYAEQKYIVSFWFRADTRRVQFTGLRPGREYTLSITLVSGGTPGNPQQQHFFTSMYARPRYSGTSAQDHLGNKIAESKDILKTVCRVVKAVDSQPRDRGSKPLRLG